MQLVRWRHVSLVFQGAMNALDPVQRVDAQIAEAIRLHEPASAGGVRERIAELLTTVGLPATHGRAYPHQLSGGQRQRVMIALALACRPALVIADEPTTALDVVMQAQVLDLLARLRRELGLALILISHDLAVLAETCDRLAVMYAGRIVESGPAAAVFASPQHPYTKRLLDSLPSIGGRRGVADPIPGAPPDPRDPPEGCAFRPRCPYAADALPGASRRCGRSARPAVRLPLRAVGELVSLVHRHRATCTSTTGTARGRARRRRVARVAPRRGAGRRRGVGLREVDARARDARAGPPRPAARSRSKAPRCAAAPSCGRCGGGCR